MECYGNVKNLLLQIIKQHGFVKPLVIITKILFCKNMQRHFSLYVFLLLSQQNKSLDTVKLSPPLSRSLSAN